MAYSNRLVQLIVWFWLLWPFVSDAQVVNELDSIIKNTHAPARFAAHCPNFWVTTHDFVFQLPTGGTFTKTCPVIKDKDKFVAIFGLGIYGITMLTWDPYQASSTIDERPRENLGQRYGTTDFSTEAWLGKSETRTGNCKVSPDGRAVTITEIRGWNSDRSATSTHTFTLRCDPYSGYVWEAECELVTSSLAGGWDSWPEIMNVNPDLLSNLWPHKWKYDKFIFGATDGTFKGYFNNLPANIREFRGNNREDIRNGSFLAWLPDWYGWGLAVGRMGDNDLKFSNPTCNVWLDQHNTVSIPKVPDANGNYTMRAVFTIKQLPPEAVQQLQTDAIIDLYPSKKAMQIKINALNDFEDQPQSIGSAMRGIWSVNLAIATGQAHSGNRSLFVKAKNTPIGPGDFLLTTPQLELEANVEYKLEAWIKYEGEGEAWVSGHYYEEDHHSPKRFTGPETPRVNSADGWKKVEVVFTAPAWAPNMDLKFVAQGTGSAYFDDFILKRLTPGAPTKIYGPTVACATTSHTFYIKPVADAKSYKWTVSGGEWSGTSQGVAINLVPVGRGGGKLSVVAVFENQQESKPFTIDLPPVASSPPVTPVIIPEAGFLKTNAVGTYKWFVNDTLVQGKLDNYLIAERKGVAYGVEVANGCGCTKSAPQLFTDIADNSPNGLQVQVYPNPAQGFVQVKVTSPDAKAQLIDLVFSDALGKVLLKKQLWKNQASMDIQLDLQVFAAGVYTLAIQSGASSVVRKIIK